MKQTLSIMANIFWRSNYFFYVLILLCRFLTEPDPGAGTTEGPVLVTAGGGAHAPHPGKDAVLGHAPGTGGGGTAAGPAHAAEGIVTAIATSRAPDTSTCAHSEHFTPKATSNDSYKGHQNLSA